MRKAGSIGSETAQGVREAALALFARRGYAAVSMRDIAAAAGLTASSLYNHFPTKQDLLCGLMEGHMRELVAAWEAESHRYASALAAFEGFVRFHIRFHAGRSDAVFVAYMELRSLEPDNFRRIEGLRRYYEGCLRKIVAQGVESGELEVDDVPVAAMAIIAMLTGVTTWYRTGGRLTIAEIEEIYVRMALGAVGVGQAETGNGAFRERREGYPHVHR